VALDDGSPNVTYSGTWDSSPNDMSQYYHAQTMHRTNSAGASFSLAFHGNALALYSAVSNNHGDFSVALDGAPAQTLSGASVSFHAQVPLYVVGGLATGDHTVVVTNTAQDAAVWFDFDYAVVSTYSDPPSNGSSTAGAPGSGSTSVPASSG
jgi:hypothetical protein